MQQHEPITLRIEGKLTSGHVVGAFQLLNGKKGIVIEMNDGRVFHRLLEAFVNLTEGKQGPKLSKADLA